MRTWQLNKTLVVTLLVVFGFACAADPASFPIPSCVMSFAPRGGWDGVVYIRKECSFEGMIMMTSNRNLGKPLLHLMQLERSVFSEKRVVLKFGNCRVPLAICRSRNKDDNKLFVTVASLYAADGTKLRLDSGDIQTSSDGFSFDLPSDDSGGKVKKVFIKCKPYEKEEGGRRWMKISMDTSVLNADEVYLSVGEVIDVYMSDIKLLYPPSTTAPSTATVSTTTTSTTSTTTQQPTTTPESTTTPKPSTTTSTTTTTPESTTTPKPSTTTSTTTPKSLTTTTPATTTPQQSTSTAPATTTPQQLTTTTPKPTSSSSSPSTSEAVLSSSVSGTSTEQSSTVKPPIGAARPRVKKEVKCTGWIKCADPVLVMTFLLCTNGAVTSLIIIILTAKGVMFALPRKPADESKKPEKPKSAVKPVESIGDVSIMPSTTQNLDTFKDDLRTFHF